jgi:hypothetical protein
VKVELQEWEGVGLQPVLHAGHSSQGMCACGAQHGRALSFLQQTQDGSVKGPTGAFTACLLTTAAAAAAAAAACSWMPVPAAVREADIFSKGESRKGATLAATTGLGLGGWKAVTVH